jgi:HAD superfamily hydrolase (TIGR01509 family)
MTLAEIEKVCAGVDGVVFDFGGVISESPLMNEWAVYPYCAKLGVDRAAVDRGWARYRNVFDGGLITFEEYYTRTFADAGATITPTQIDDLWKLDAESWIRTLRADTLALVHRLKACGKKLGVLSNMSPDFYERLFVPRCAEYRALLDAEVISGLHRLYKPEEPIYRLAESKMGLTPDRLLFLDDLEPNVLAARAFGWRAEVYPPA